MAEYTAEFGRLWDNKLTDASCAYIKIYVRHNAKALAIPYVDNFLLPQITYSQNNTPQSSLNPLYAVFSLYILTFGSYNHCNFYVD